MQGHQVELNPISRPTYQEKHLILLPYSSYEKQRKWNGYRYSIPSHAEISLELKSFSINIENLTID